MLIALPNIDGSFTCTLFLPFNGQISFSALTRQSEVEKFFDQYLGDAKNLVSSLTESFFQNPTGQMVTVKTTRWTLGDSVALIGDAAHAIVPFFGQGMNAGFEDVSWFCKLLDKGLVGESLLREYSTGRKLNSDSIAQLALENFIEMRDDVGNVAFRNRKAIDQYLEKMLPEIYRSRYGLVTFTNVPYSVALEAGEIQKSLLAEFSEKYGNAADVDLLSARKLIEERLGFLAKYLEVR